MTYENITLRKRNVTMIDGYYYMFDQDQDALIVKTDDGTQAYSYPLDTIISNEVVSLEYDGRNFWSLENPGGNDVYIKRWNFENYILKIRDDFNISEDGSNKFDSNAMTVEHYHLRFYSDEPAGSNPIQMYVPKTEDSDFDLTAKLQSGMVISLGPNVDGQREDISVSSVTNAGTVGGQTIYNVNLNSATTYDYSGPESPTPADPDYRELYGDPASFYNKIWLFNNYDGTDSGSGALYSMSAYTEKGSLTKYPGGEYKNVRACTFYDVPNYIFDRAWQETEAEDSTNWPKYNSIAYVRTTNLIFLNPDDHDNSYGSMTMDNLEDDQATVITVYDLTMEGVNVYRLQNKATYYGSTYDWSSYNYQLSTLEPFITSISLRANPAILPANLTNTSEITAIVKDQFDLAISSKLVYFTDDDTAGEIIGANPATTDADGVAITTYRAGDSAREVKITATAQQGGVETPDD